MKYRLVARANPQDREVASKYYAVPVYSGEMDLKRISGRIADKSSLAPSDVYNVLVHFVEDLPEYMSDGFKVSLGDFGIFKASFNSEGFDDPKKFNTTMIRGKKVLYHAGKDVKNGWSNPWLDTNGGRKVSFGKCHQR